MTESSIPTSDVRQKTFFTTKAIVKKIKQEDGTESTLIELPFSSISEDRDGDNFSIEGLKDLVEQINTKRIPLYLNHGWGDGPAIYDVMDMIGYWKDARIDDESISWASMVFDDEDERAGILARKIEAGLPIGVSVGFIPLDTDTGKSGQIFNKTDLLEMSTVGIPSNRQAVHANGLDSIVGLVAKKFGLVAKDNSEDEIMTQKEAKKTKMEEEDEEEKMDEDEEEAEETLTIAAIKELLAENNKLLLAALKPPEDEGDTDEEEKAEGEDEDEEEKAEGDEPSPEEKPQPKAAKPKALEPKGIATSSPVEMDGEEVQKNTPTFTSPF